MKKEGPDIKKEIMVRVKLLYVFFFLIGICIFGRIVWLQYGPEGKELREKAETTNFTLARVDATRGEIVTADGELLATSVQKYYVGIDFRAKGLEQDVFDANVDGLAESMAKLMGDYTKATYKTMLQNGWKNREKVRYRRLTNRLISYGELQEVRSFPLMNLPANQGGRVIDVVTKRVRPYERLAERTIGKTVEVRDTLIKPHKDSTKRQKTYILTEKGQSGIEYSFNDQLKGQSGWMLKQKIADNFYIPVPESDMNVEPVNGRDVVTTLNMDFQDVAESHLESQLQKFNGLFGTVVLMEVATGEIKAISNLTNRGGVCFENYNYAVGGLFEPGSTFKLASLLALLDDGMNLSDPVYLGDGKLELRKAKFKDDHEPESSTVSLQRVFETSSNVGFVQAVEKRFVETKREGEFVDYIVNLGFDHPIDMGMAGEAKPKLHKPTAEEKKNGRWHSNSLSYMSHGYGLEVSPLHTLMLYNAVANNGRMVKPQLIKELREQGQTVQKFGTEVVNPSIAPARTIKAVRTSLEGVVDEGTATVLKNPYYKVAAKTGTAQMLTGGRYLGSTAGQLYLATMVGYFPADNPKYSCIVAIATRYGSGAWNYYGSSLAGPVFKAIADRVYVTHYDWQEPVNKTLAKSEIPPAVKGGPDQLVRKAAKELDIRLDDQARKSDWVTTGKDSVRVTATALRIENGVVPSVEGMGLQDALFLLESRGLKVDFSGKGKVVAQFPKAGENVRKGATVTLSLK